MAINGSALRAFIRLDFHSFLLQIGLSKCHCLKIRLNDADLMSADPGCSVLMYWKPMMIKLFCISLFASSFLCGLYHLTTDRAEKNNLAKNNLAKKNLAKKNPLKLAEMFDAMCSALEEGETQSPVGPDEKPLLPKLPVEVQL